MKVIKIGRLEIVLLHNVRSKKHPEVMVDWDRFAGNGWRFHVSTHRLWTPMGFPTPSRHSRRGPVYWSFWRFETP